MSTHDLKELPPVAKSFFMECKKCASERYHKVLAHKTATSAKVQCEVCGSIKTFNLKSSSRSVGGAVAGGGSRKTMNSSPKASSRAVGVSKMAALYKKEYDDLLGSLKSEDPVLDYSMRSKFQAKQKINHLKFGLGLVRTAHLDRLEVLFPDQMRVLVHNRA